KQRVVAIEPQPPIQQRMMIKDARFRPALFVRLAVATRVRQLQSDDEAVIASACLFVFFNQRFAQPGKLAQILFIDQQLIRVGASFVENSNRFSPPDQLGAASSKMNPATSREIAGFSLRSSVPSFHGMNGESIAYPDMLEEKRLCERRLASGDKLVVTRYFYLTFFKLALESLRGFYAANM